MRQPGNFSDGLKRSGFTVRMHDRDQCGFLSQAFLHALRKHPPGTVDLHTGHPVALLLQPGTGTGGCRVLYNRSQYVAARRNGRSHPPDRQVVGFGAA